MKKKICFAMIFCFILSMIAGCGPKKLEPFGMTLEDMNKKINENLKALGYTMTVPEFKEEKEDKTINYSCDVSTNLSITLVQYSTDGTYYIIVLMMFPLRSTNSEILSNWKDYIAVSSAIIAAVDPNADIKSITTNLKMYSTADSELSCKVNSFSYESRTSIASKTFLVTSKDLK